MRLLGPLITTTLLIGLTIGQQPSEPKESQYWREIQQEILQSPHIFPNKDIINQRYGLFLRPLVLNHVFETPSFNNFISYYTKNLNPDNAMYVTTKQNVEAALNQTFDFLVKQYGKLDANLDLEQAIANQKVKRDTEMQQKLKFFLSDAFTKELLQKTGELLDRTKKVKPDVAPEPYKMSIDGDEMPFDSYIPSFTETDKLQNEEQRESIRHRRTVFPHHELEITEKDVMDYDSLSKVEKFGYLVRDELLNPIADKIIQRVDRTKRAYMIDGFKSFFPFGPLTPFFIDTDVVEEERELEKRGSGIEAEYRETPFHAKLKDFVESELIEPASAEMNYKMSRLKRAFSINGLKGVAAEVFTAPTEYDLPEEQAKREADEESKEKMPETTIDA